MNSSNKSTGWLFGLAFLIALILRLLQLGALPLTDHEAEFALQAMNIVGGFRPAIGPQPAYVLLTVPIFYLFGAYNFAARLIPALAGSFLVFVPLLFERKLKRAAIFVAFFFALDPGLVAISRQAAGNILAVTFFLFAWAYWDRAQIKLSGFFAALALLSGPLIWAGLLGFGISLALMQFVSQKPVGAEQPDGHQAAGESREIKAALPSFIITLFAAGTLFLLVPNGLSAAVKSLPAYIGTWIGISELTSGRLFFVLLVYQPFTILLALVALIRGWWFGKRRVMRLSIWLLVSLLLVVFNPGRQVTDLAWTLIPLLTLAGMELARHTYTTADERREIASVMGLVFFILVFSWMAFASLTWVPVPSDQATLRIELFGGALTLLLFSVILIGAGWSLRVAKLGTLYALVVAFSLYNLSAVMAVSGVRANPSPEFWPSDPRPAQANLLLQTVDDLSDWDKGDKHSLPVTIVDLHSPALDWLLRQREVIHVDTLDVSTSPAFVITSQRADPSIAAAYRGQDFIWNQYPNWNSALVADWLRWLSLRQMPQTDTTILLWARADLFVDRPTVLSNP